MVVCAVLAVLAGYTISAEISVLTVMAVLGVLTALTVLYILAVFLYWPNKLCWLY